MQRADVIVVGAGMAGLAAAKKMRKAGVRVVVLEARARIGGRALTNVSALGEPMDEGASFLHNPDRNPLTAVVRRYGFTEVDAFADVHHFDGSRTLPATRSAARRNAYARVMKDVSHAAARGIDVAVSDVVRPADPYERLVVNEMAACTAGVDAEHLSTMDVATKVREVHDGCGGTRQDAMVREGLGRFVAEFGADVPVELNAAVGAIGWSGHSVVVTSARSVHTARAALVTAPTGVLASGRISFAPLLPPWKTQAFCDLPMASFKTIHLELDPRALARFPHGSSVEDLTDSRMSFIIRPAGSTRMVLAMTGGALARRLDACEDRAAVEYVLARLARVLGHPVGDTLVRALVPRWNRDPWTGGGSYSAARPGRHTARRIAQEPLQNSLYFTGEAYDSEWATYLPGAYRTGIAAASRILAETFGTRAGATSD